MLLMLPVLVLLIAAYLPGHIKAQVKNPMLMALKAWALAHLLINGNLASMRLFGSFLSFGVIDLTAVKRSGHTDRSSQFVTLTRIGPNRGGLSLLNNRGMRVASQCESRERVISS